MANDPIHQFQIKELAGPFHIGGLEISYTNSALFMTFAIALSALLFWGATRARTMVPGRLQSTAEVLYEFVADMVMSNAGKEGMRYFPFIFTLFTLILVMNILGMFLTFTATSQLAVTVTFAVLTFGLVVVVGFAKNGLGFFKLFWPMGAPLALRPVVGLIEFVSFLLRPVTLALRLFGNMLGGHVALKIFAGFVVSLGALAMGGGLNLLAFPVAALSLGMVVALTALEFLVAFLQAFVFAVLACIYLNDVVNLGHGH